MLTYRQIQNDKHFAEIIWNAEELAPRWFKEAGAVWHPTFESYQEFWGQCPEIFGLFNDVTLVACVYLQFLSDVEVNIHISVIGKAKENDLVRFFESLKRQKALDGVTVMTGWLLDRNVGLRRIAEKAGFVPTGAKMDYGQARGKILRWIQMRG